MLVYIDQNILSIQAKSATVLSLPGHQFVYSDSHLNEIARSNRPEIYLNALERISAQYLTVAIENGLPTDKVLLFKDHPSEIFNSHLRKVEAHPFSGLSFSGAMAWFNGGGNIKDALEFPEQLGEILQMSQKAMSEASTPILESSLKKSRKRLETLVNSSFPHGNDVESWRESVGGPRTGFNDVCGARELLEIWEVIRNYVPQGSPEKFYGFELFDETDEFETPQCIGITICCTILDLLGFRAEKKRRKAIEQPNVQSDAMHIAMAAYCDVLFSADKKLIQRAQSIYEFRNISTKSFYIQPDN